MIRQLVASEASCGLQAALTDATHAISLCPDNAPERPWLLVRRAQALEGLMQNKQALKCYKVTQLCSLLLCGSMRLSHSRYILCCNRACHVTSSYSFEGSTAWFSLCRRHSNMTLQASYLEKRWKVHSSRRMPRNMGASLLQSYVLFNWYLLDPDNHFGVRQICRQRSSLLIHCVIYRKL